MNFQHEASAHDTTDTGPTPLRQFVVREHLATPIGAFVVVALAVGTLFAVLTPALTGYDEGQHVLRAWQLSSGHVRPSEGVDRDGQRGLGGVVPSDLRAQMRQIFVDGVEPGRASRAFAHMRDRAPTSPSASDPGAFEISSAAVYAPVPYLPAAVTLRVARTLDLSLFASVLLMRLAGLIAYVAIVAAAIHRIPNRKWLVAILALAPVCVVQASTVSADGVTIALSLLTVALAIRLGAMLPGAITKRDVAEVAVVVAALGLSKPPYFLIAALFVPTLWKQRRCLSSARLAVALVPGASAFAVWSAYSQSKFVPPVFAPVPGQYAYTGVDPSAQMRFVRSHPIDFVHAVGRTISRTWQSLLHDAVAQVPNWGIAGWIAVAIALATFAAIAWSAMPRRGGTDVCGELTEATSRPALRWALAGTAAVLTATIFLLAYTGWNQVGAPRIDAFQGRYLFVPVALIALAFGDTRVTSSQNDTIGILQLIALTFVGASSIVTLLMMFVRFY